MEVIGKTLSAQLLFRSGVVSIMALTILAIAFSQSVAVETSPILVGIYDMDPLCCIHQGTPKGVFVSLMGEIAKREKWSLKFVKNDLEQLQENLKSGKIDLLIGVPHDENISDSFDFSKETIISTWGQIYVSEQIKVQSILDLKTLSIGVVKGDPYYTELRDVVSRLNIRCRFVEFKLYEGIVNALESGWIDAGALDRFFGIRNKDRKRIQKTPIIFAPIELRFAVAKGDGKQLIPILDYHLNLLKKRTDSVYYRFLDDTVGKSENTRLIQALRTGIGTLVIFLLMATIIGFLLRQQVKSRTAELTVKNCELGLELKQRQMAESAARQSEARYKSVFENTGTATVIVEPDMTISKINATAEALMELPKKNVEGIMKVADFISDGDEEIFQVIQHKRERMDDRPLEFEFNMFDKHGMERDVFARVGSIPDTGQRVVSLIDMTDRNRSEAERLRLATVVEQSSESILIMNTARSIQYVNPSFETMSGYLRKEVIGKTPDFLHSDTHSPETLNKIEMCIASGGTWTGRVLNLKKSGEKFIAETKISPIWDSEGNMSGCVNIKRDVTAEVQMEEELRQAQKLQGIGRLAGGISHDFNNILAGIMGYAELTALHVNRDKTLQAYIDEILAGCRRASNLINQILTFSRRQKPEKKPINIQAVLMEALKLVKATIPSSIEIKTFFQADEAVVSADSTQIHQMVINLCTNAAQAMMEGGVLKIKLLEMAMDPRTNPKFINLSEGRYIQLTVADTGHGMCKEVMDKLFDPFFTTKAIGKGTGLGLSVVHGIVKNHGGTIDVESELEKGSTFHVYLPVISGKEAAETIEKPTLRGGRETILFVDDEPAIGMVAKRSLEGLGYSVMAKSSSTEALQCFEKNPSYFDLVITDRTMPNMSGIDLSRKLHSIRKDLPVIMCTGFSETETESLAMSAGIFECLQKPLERATLASAVRRVLDRN